MMNYFNWKKRELGEQKFKMFLLDVVFSALYIALGAVIVYWLNWLGLDSILPLQQILMSIFTSFFLLAVPYLLSRRIIKGKIYIDFRTTWIYWLLIFVCVGIGWVCVYFYLTYSYDVSDYIIRNIRNIIQLAWVGVPIISTFLMTRLIFRFVFEKKSKED